MSEQSAQVDVLTAEVRTLMVGRRQVTLSVYRQLDTVDPDDIEPFGRVRDKRTREGYVEVVGRANDGSLVRADRLGPPARRIQLVLNHHGDIVEQVASRDPDVSFFSLPRPVVLQRDGFAVYVGGERIKRCDQSSYRKPDSAAGDWWFVSSSVQQRALAQAEQLIDGAVTRREAAAKWEALPLIVLAGLR